ncbi:MAG TPA: GNAT family N-acetyltransferase [Candidatus Ozemobacteraceae bacterium]|nr:GNAT family N-acetyltransferase [Candidatus Ozemobacteraceae bacterium]
MQPLTPEPARKTDGPAIITLERELFSSVDVFKPAQLSRLLRVPSCRVLVMRSADGELVAEVVGLMRRFRGRSSGRIYKIAVHRSLWGIGAAGRLLEAMESVFRREGMQAVCAEARVGNTASRHFFEKHGYRMTNALPRYYADGEDGCKFWKNL